MKQFYRISDNTSYLPGMPVVSEIISGVTQYGPCPKCGQHRRTPEGDLKVRLGDDPAKFWPDAIACVANPSFVVSDRFINALEQFKVKIMLGGRVELVEPIENGLKLEAAPSYFWVDGNRHYAAKMDFEASGFVNVQFCGECGRRTNDISLTYDRRHYSKPPPPYVFHLKEKCEMDLFTTDLAPTAFFCTQRVLECAGSYQLKNLAFDPVADGVYGKPVKY